MKKVYYVITGIVVGVVLSVGTSAYATEISALVGKKIQSEWTVTLDGTQIDNAIIVDGKSYAPVRSISEAVGLEVGFQGKNVILNTKKAGGDVLTKTESLEMSIEATKSDIKFYQSFLEMNPDFSPEKKSAINEKIAALNEQLVSLEKQKSEIK
ncbi:hypothetical protein [Paenibacillus sinopodophylli]|uniref:hypothetical protein n=1 Tax=Paenibacillus sinopodophylli TaxID=1837342 RepID=UPI00110CB96B|nr:hypothetical protein [Paenibacillus sinopodophylli]